jgi:hypothetical protein
MNGTLQKSNDTAIGIAKCSNGNLGVVIKLTPVQGDEQYKIIPLEMALTLKGDEFVDSNNNTWIILDYNC